MRRKFKNYEDAESYFMNFEMNKLNSPQEFDIIYQISQEMINSPVVPKEKVKLWKDLQEKAFKRAEELGWKVISDENIPEFCKKLSEMLTPEQMADFICQVSDFSEFNDEELNVILQFCNECEEGPNIEKLMDLVYDERAKRNPNLN